MNVEFMGQMLPPPPTIPVKEPFDVGGFLNSIGPGIANLSTTIISAVTGKRQSARALEIAKAQSAARGQLPFDAAALLPLAIPVGVVGLALFMRKKKK